MIKGKKAVEWYILISLILLVVSIIFIILWQTGALSKVGNMISEGLFKPIE